MNALEFKGALAHCIFGTSEDAVLCVDHARTRYGVLGIAVLHGTLTIYDGSMLREFRSLSRKPYTPIVPTTPQKRVEATDQVAMDVQSAPTATDAAESVSAVKKNTEDSSVSLASLTPITYGFDEDFEITLGWMFTAIDLLMDRGLVDPTKDVVVRSQGSNSTIAMLNTTQEAIDEHEKDEEGFVPLFMFIVTPSSVDDVRWLETEGEITVTIETEEDGEESEELADDDILLFMDDTMHNVLTYGNGDVEYV